MNAPQILQGLDNTSCTATAQIIAYWLTGKKRLFNMLIDDKGLQLSQWSYEDVWSTPSPQLISVDLSSHRFTLVVLPGVGQALLLQSNQWPGEKYTFEQWVNRKGFCSTLPHFIMDINSYGEFMRRLIANTPEDTMYLFGADYKWTLCQARVAVSEISASIWSENSLNG